MDNFYCSIILGIITLVFVILLIRTVREAKAKSDGGLAAEAMVYLLCAIGPAVLLVGSMKELLMPPVVSSCEQVVDGHGDTLYEFRDATRYCLSHIPENDTSTVFTVMKEDASSELSRTDICIYCQRLLREHPLSQTIDSITNNNDWHWEFVPY